jgi:phage-related holin
MDIKNMMTGILKILSWLCTAFASWFLAFVTPIAPFLTFVIVLVVMDLFTGTRAAVHRKETIHSRGLRRSVEKIALYFVAILLSKATEAVFVVDWSIPYIVTGLIASTELKSNFENISQVTGVDIWARLVAKLPSLGDLLPPKKEGDKNG